MPFKFQDLMITVLPSSFGEGGGDASGCNGCSGGGTSTVGSCTSECGVQCGDTGEIFEVTPFEYVDPAYVLELRQLAVYGLTSSPGVSLSQRQSAEALEAQMQPKTAGELELLEKKLSDALEAVRTLKAQKKT